MYVHGSEERLLQGARGDKLDGLESTSVLKKANKEKKNARLRGESFTWPVSETNYRSKK